nr:glycoside hydrolase family 15 protein [Ramlibacter cellulosilyticus]
MGPPSIGDHAAIGDCRSLALVSRHGSIDWFCTPVFSAPSVFGALLDAERGGHYLLAPPAHTLLSVPQQQYEPGSNVLRTTYTCAGGTVEALDFMPVAEAGASSDERVPQQLIRSLRCTGGEVELAGRLQPRPAYAARQVAWRALHPQAWRCDADGFSLSFCSTLPFRAEGQDLVASSRMREGERHVSLIQAPAATRINVAALATDVEERLASTLAWWRAWCGRCTYRGPHAGDVVRSALTLKLLTYRPSGAVVAAATTSIPEGPDGRRNWDYRYCWLRDTSLVLHAFVDLGYVGESDAFLRWLLHATRSTGDRLQVVYDVHGEPLLAEHVVGSLAGYHGIGPVRIGNAASGQVQHDVYGEVLLTACEHARAGGMLDPGEKQLLARLAHRICAIWRQPDQGIWEVRLPPRHNTHSKLMCWAGLDRALWLHDRHGVPLDRAHVARERELLRADIDASGFDASLDSYVGVYGTQWADASLLLIPRLGYLPARDPRVLGTVQRIFRELSVKGLLYRYPPDQGYDGVSGEEHLFAICNFWAVDCLVRQGRVDEALRMYERLLSLRNHVGLYAEEFRVENGTPMGNFPQAFSHVGLITAALALGQAMGVARAGAA